MINKTVPLCSSQYERQFNTTRIPGIETGISEYKKQNLYGCKCRKCCVDGNKIICNNKNNDFIRTNIHENLYIKTGEVCVAF